MKIKVYYTKRTTNGITGRPVEFEETITYQYITDIEWASGGIVILFNGDDKVAVLKNFDRVENLDKNCSLEVTS